MSIARQLIILLISLSVQLSSCAQQSTTKSMKPLPKNAADMTEQDWKERLSSEQYYILREKGTERPFTGALLMNKEKGNYICAACGNILFSSDSKFDSHCGWPSFDKEIAQGKIKYVEDRSHGMVRTEIICANCGGHLGHVFDDGPTSTGLRYCVNSISLEFVPVSDSTKTSSTLSQDDTAQIVLGGGCFWCIEAVYQRLEGVYSVESGYQGGTVANPTYKQVCSGQTNHAEVARITYNPKVISFEEILKVFFTVHDPTQLNRQGNDVGTQYRSVIFYKNEQQRQAAQEVIDALNKEQVYDKPIVTTLEADATFYIAEQYHQNYYNQNKKEPYCLYVIQPKVAKFEKVFAERLKK